MTRKICCFMAIVVLSLSLSAASADTYVTYGDGRTTVRFYVQSSGSASIQFTQTEGQCQELSYTHLIDGIQGVEEEWGKYHFYITDPYGRTSVEDWDKTFNGDSFSITLPMSGTYEIRVVPYTAQEMTDSWTLDHFVEWTSQPNWWISNWSRCAISINNPNIKSGTVTAICYHDGRQIGSKTYEISSSQTIDAPTISGYHATPSSVYISFNNGVCNPSTVSFVYEKDPISGELIIKCFEENGNYIQGEVKEIASSQTIYPPSISGYQAISSGEYVSLDTMTGRCNPQQVNFYYKKNQSGSMLQFPRSGYSLTLNNPYADRIRPQCGPGYQYQVFASMNGSTKLYNPWEITYLQAHFCDGSWVYVEFGYSDGKTRYGFFEKSLFTPSVSWDRIPSYTLRNHEKTGVVVSDTTPCSGPGDNHGQYSSCRLYSGTAVHACMEYNGWYLCRFYNDHSNNYGDIYLWVPGYSISWY